MRASSCRDEDGWYGYPQVLCRHLGPDWVAYYWLARDVVDDLDTLADVVE
jgi:hypothetical protein